MRQGGAEIETGAAGELQGGLTLDEPFIEGGEGGDQLDGGAGRKSAFERGLLVDDGENAPGLGIDHHDRAVIRAESIDGRAAYGEIVAIHVVAGGGVEDGGLGQPGVGGGRRVRTAGCRLGLARGWSGGHGTGLGFGFGVGLRFALFGLVNGLDRKSARG